MRSKADIKLELAKEAANDPFRTFVKAMFRLGDAGRAYRGRSQVRRMQMPLGTQGRDAILHRSLRDRCLVGCYLTTRPSASSSRMVALSRAPNGAQLGR
ncbi:MAG: hypothetical protein ACYSW3_29900 [Planctomycetota bacterium]